MKLDIVPPASGAAESQRIDASQVALASTDALPCDKRPMPAMPAGDTQRLMGFPNVVKVRGWRDHFASSSWAGI
ncbi:MAG: hypothetical protein KIT25_19035 [Enhydrobacter sp.]|nr:MAG: hypothetical protein KIT25_19035 [Enhydrobacter sp.]